jgi:hypothetical protein
VHFFVIWRGGFGGSGRRSATQIGRKICQGEVSFVTDSSDHRNRAITDRSHYSLFVERPQIFK